MQTTTEMTRELRDIQAKQDKAKAQGDWSRWMTLEGKASRLADRIVAKEAGR